MVNKFLGCQEVDLFYARFLHPRKSYRPSKNFLIVTVLHPFSHWYLLLQFLHVTSTAVNSYSNRSCPNVIYLNTHHLCKPPHNQSWGCRHWLADSVYYSLSLTERKSKGCHKSTVSKDLINRTCHIGLHAQPFSEIIKAIPICCNYNKHVTINLCPSLIWVVERIN